MFFISKTGFLRVLPLYGVGKIFRGKPVKQRGELRSGALVPIPFKKPTNPKNSTVFFSRVGWTCVVVALNICSLAVGYRGSKVDWVALRAAISPETPALIGTSVSVLPLPTPSGKAADSITKSTVFDSRPLLPPVPLPINFSGNIPVNTNPAVFPKLSTVSSRQFDQSEEESIDVILSHSRASTVKVPNSDEKYAAMP